ncbi:hypothetical protein HYFRA_00011591 [Hymenoscyphus fraxineus]|uniref:NAD-dependent epimerase/dehydratase domain-containing protein n=1 Tax=Hymenoscyphus fraxineus TaxID=746836 RepID=A0A9N9PYJ3_9HELO|nr:hypothetical protein HYFRA_00011591 [Hymenoscyphus fraxineus]
MVNVLLLGATGYIGKELCHSLVRGGDHRVYGLARTAEKAKDLAKEEVIPIIGSTSDTQELLNSIEKHRIDVIVDLMGAELNTTKTLISEIKKIGAARLEAASEAGIRIQKLGFIYCSGTWLHGSSNEPVSDLTPVAASNSPTPPAELTSWRAIVEKEVLDCSDVLDVMIVRPALVYGRSHPIWGIFFGPIHAASQDGSSSVGLAADPESRPGLVHVDDVASGFHAAIEKLPLISGTGVYPVFDLVSSQESMKDILNFAAKTIGYNGKVELVGAGDDLFAKAMSTSMNNHSARAKQILGWEPRKTSFVQGMDIYAKGFVAATV